MAVPKRKKCKSRACIRININRFKKIMFNKIKTNLIVNNNILVLKKYLKKKSLLLL